MDFYTVVQTSPCRPVLDNLRKVKVFSLPRNYAELVPPQLSDACVRRGGQRTGAPTYSETAADSPEEKTAKKTLVRGLATLFRDRVMKNFENTPYAVHNRFYQIAQKWLQAKRVACHGEAKECANPNCNFKLAKDQVAQLPYHPQDENAKVWNCDFCGRANQKLPIGSPLERKLAEMKGVRDINMFLLESARRRDMCAHDTVHFANKCCYQCWTEDAVVRSEVVEVVGPVCSTRSSV